MRNEIFLAVSVVLTVGAHRMVVHDSMQTASPKPCAAAAVASNGR